MKKLFLLFLVFALTNCEIKVQTRQAQAQETSKSVSQEVRYDVLATTYTKDGIDYIVFTAFANGSNGGRAVSVVNVTKDKLEMDKLKLEIELLNLQKSKLKYE